MVDKEEDREDAIFGSCLLWLKTLDRATNGHNQTSQLDSAALEGQKTNRCPVDIRFLFFNFKSK